MDEKAWSRGRVVFMIAVMVMGAGFLVPVPCSAVPGNSPDTVITISTLSVTNASLPDPDAAPKFRETARPVQIGVTVSETALPGLKGEMAAGPRAIGISIDPLVLATGLLALVVAGSGVLMYMKRKEDEKNNEGEENEKDRD
jgi:hypothetical protein